MDEPAVRHDPIRDGRDVAPPGDPREDRVDRVELEVPRIAHETMVADLRDAKESSKEPAITSCSEPM
jgi:hypothetical protein